MLSLAARRARVKEGAAVLGQPGQRSFTPFEWKGRINWDKSFKPESCEIRKNRQSPYKCNNSDPGGSMRRCCKVRSWFLLSTLTVLAGVAPVRAQQGLMLSGAGPINRSMGGASTAAPLDSIGALYWNPATTSGLPGSELAFGVELLFPQARLSSSLPIGVAGTTTSDAGVFVLPSVGLVYQPEDSRWTFGLGLFAPTGFAVNYPGSTSNPVLTPPPPSGFGFGPLAAQYEVFQIAPTVSYQLTDRLSIGFGPILDLATLRIDPALITSPNATGAYPRGNPSEYAWGAGFQVGLYYVTEAGWHFGTALKSPQWFESFEYHTIDALGQPRDFHFHFNNPLIWSVGGAYSGFERWTLATDLRFINYRDTVGFSHTGFDATGALRGLGWDNVFVLALGAQYQLTEALSLRMGYTFNTNPINSDIAAFNVASPLIVQHTLAVGASYSFNRCFSLSAAYVHSFENSVQGAIISPFGPIPGSSVQSDAWADSFIFGGTVKF
jgi:long-chain fatty acid transport protein